MSEHEHKPHNWAAIGVVLALLPMAGGLIAQWAVMNEARRMAETRDLEQNALAAALEERIRNLENNRAIETRIAELSERVTGRLAAVETELSALRRDVRGREGRR